MAALLAVFLSMSALHAEESAGSETRHDDSTSEHEHNASWIIRSDAHHNRPMQIDVSLGLEYIDGLSLAGYFDLPIVHDGFIPRINDSFDLEFGLIIAGHLYGLGYYYGDTYYSGAGLTITPLVGVKWNFYLTKDWTVFAALRFGWNIPVNWYGTFAVVGTAGALWRFNDTMSLRLEIGYPAISAGLTWDL